MGHEGHEGLPDEVVSHRRADGVGRGSRGGVAVVRRLGAVSRRDLSETFRFSSHCFYWPSSDAHRRCAHRRGCRGRRKHAADACRGTSIRARRRAGSVRTSRWRIHGGAPGLTSARARVVTGVVRCLTQERLASRALLARECAERRWASVSRIRSWRRSRPAGRSRSDRRVPPWSWTYR